MTKATSRQEIPSAFRRPTHDMAPTPAGWDGNQTPKAMTLLPWGPYEDLGKETRGAEPGTSRDKERPGFGKAFRRPIDARGRDARELGLTNVHRATDGSILTADSAITGRNVPQNPSRATQVPGAAFRRPGIDGEEQRRRVDAAYASKSPGYSD